MTALGVLVALGAALGLLAVLALTRSRRRALPSPTEAPSPPPATALRRTGLWHPARGRADETPATPRLAERRAMAAGVLAPLEVHLGGLRGVLGAACVWLPTGQVLGTVAVAPEAASLLEPLAGPLGAWLRDAALRLGMAHEGVLEAAVTAGEHQLVAARAPALPELAVVVVLRTSGALGATLPRVREALARAGDPAGT